MMIYHGLDEQCGKKDKYSELVSFISLIYYSV